ncbi:gtpase-activator protein for Ras family gtpase [Thraustotheca clavata]|uniref:Gtpase-activator protein for Ras family gtpase n=1 Tax=Thraustotheca clavata TaxID=74557 RepID=A0A1V9Z9Z1_9STRA|nr:gtpase-activator protein for Ras family gtpase [Thraustotheca clavata]
MQQLVPALACLLQDKIYVFLRVVVDAQVQKVTESTNLELFRGNSSAMRFLSEVAYFVGKEYLQDVLQTPLEIVWNSVETFEMNDSVSDEMQLQANRTRLENITQMILDRLFNGDVPMQLARLCLYFRRSIAVQFHSHTDAVVAGFLFLRVLCPAVVLPQKIGLFQGQIMQPIARRGTMLIAKLLQNLANNVLFGPKEEFMTPFNGFIRRNYTGVVSFYDKICAAAISTEHEISSISSPMTPRTALKIIEAQRTEINVTDLILAQSNEPAVLMSAPIDRSSQTSFRNSQVRAVNSSHLTRTVSTFVQRGSSFFMTSRGEGTSRKQSDSDNRPVQWKEAKVVMGSLNHQDIRQRHSQYIDSIRRGAAYLGQAMTDDQIPWQPLKFKHGIQLYSREKNGITEIKATIEVPKTYNNCFTYLCSSRGRKLWNSPWSYEKEVELIDHTTRVLYKSTNQSKLWPFSGSIMDMAIIESAWASEGEATLLFQSLRRKDIPLVQGHDRVELRWSGFFVRAESAIASTITALWRYEKNGNSNHLWQKNIFHLANVKQALM